ncbi:MAG: hypothetical protein WAU33_10405 [Candidatus Binataceae bacterium]
MSRQLAIFLGLLIALAYSSQASAQIPSIDCKPKVLYCGDTLTVEFKNRHAGADFAIALAYGSELRMLSFQPGPNDRIPPLIPPDEFARMKEFRLRTDTARGSPSEGWEGNCVPRVKGIPEPIFTVTGYYQVMVGYDLWERGYELGFGSCRVEYIDNLRPKPGDQSSPKPCHPDAEAEMDRKVAEIRAQSVYPILCEPLTLYKGDTLTVDLPVPHDDYEFGISRGVDHPELLMSFKPNPPDTIAPMIPFDAFRKMKQVKILTTKAKGSPALGANTGPCFKRVDQPPQLIFTASGDYGVEIGPSLDGEDPDVRGWCLVRYIDAPHPAASSRDIER